MASAAEQLAANMNFGAFQKATELHKRIWFTLIALVVYRLGTFIPIPGIDPVAFSAAFEAQSKGILGMFNMFSGGAVERMAIFALNVMPYISASIIVQLLGTIYPPWEKLRKEGGEAGPSDPAFTIGRLCLDHDLGRGSEQRLQSFGSRSWSPSTTWV